MPKNVYRHVEDNAAEIEENVPEDAPVPVPTTHEMKNIESWCHYTRNILKTGRTTHIEPVVEDEELLEQAKKDQEANDPSANRLVSISNDAKVKGGLPAWTIRFHGD